MHPTPQRARPKHPDDESSDGKNQVGSTSHAAELGAGDRPVLTNTESMPAVLAPAMSVPS